MKRTFHGVLAPAAVVTVVLACIPAPALAQTDHSGAWKLREPPNSGHSRVETIEQRWASVTITST